MNSLAESVGAQEKATAAANDGFAGALGLGSYLRANRGSLPLPVAKNVWVIMSCVAGRLSHGCSNVDCSLVNVECNFGHLIKCAS